MVCGNKTDMRPEAEAQGRKIIKYEEGQRLSRVRSVANIKFGLDNNCAFRCVYKEVESNQCPGTGAIVPRGGKSQNYI